MRRRSSRPAVRYTPREGRGGGADASIRLPSRNRSKSGWRTRSKDLPRQESIADRDAYSRRGSRTGCRLPSYRGGHPRPVRDSGCALHRLAKIATRLSWNSPPGVDVDQRRLARQNFMGIELRTVRETDSRCARACRAPAAARWPGAQLCVARELCATAQRSSRRLRANRRTACGRADFDRRPGRTRGLCPSGVRRHRPPQRAR